MTREKIEFFCALLIVIWATYKYIKNKRARYLHCIILFVGSMLWWYPFLLPLEAGFTLWSALGAWIVFQEARKQGRGSLLTTVVWILLAFTIVFLSKTLLELKANMPDYP